MQFADERACTSEGQPVRSALAGMTYRPAGVMQVCRALQVCGLQPSPMRPTGVYFISVYLFVRLYVNLLPRQLASLWRGPDKFLALSAPSYHCRQLMIGVPQRIQSAHTENTVLDRSPWDLEQWWNTKWGGDRITL